MGDRLKPVLRGVAGAVALLSLSGCQSQESKSGADAPTAATPGSVESMNATLRATAEPFEVLTEKAFSADWAQIDTLVGNARAAVSKAALPGDINGQLAQRVATIDAARSARDRVGLALASVEGYRELVEAQDPATASPPIAVSLLDYAGFRYDALAQAPTVDWAEMARSVEFARSQWSSVEPKVRSKAMPGVIKVALDAMALAVQRKDVAFARSAAATELALVDLLEENTAAR